MLEVINFALLGAAAGGIVAVLALGVNVTHRASGVVNFSHAATAIAAAYLYDDVRATLPVPIAIIAALGLGLLVGAVTDLVIMRPLREASALTRAIATIGVLLALQSGLSIRYGQVPVLVPPWLPSGPISLGALDIGEDRLVVLAIGVGTTAVLWAVYQYTPFGIASTALAESPRSLAALGTWRPSTVSLLNWCLAGFLAAFAGVLIAPLTVLNPSQALSLVVPVLSAALLGRFRSFWATFAGGTAIGIAQAELGRLNLFQGATDLLPFLLIVLVLALRGSALPNRGEKAEGLPLVASGRVPWIPLGAVVVVLLLLIAVVLSEEWVIAITAGLMSAVVLLSLVVVVGYAGQLSLASFALAGVAALASAQLVAAAHWSFLPAAVVGVLATAPVGFLVGLPAVRTRGVSLAIATLGLAVVLQSVVFNAPAISGGYSGLSLGTPRLLGIDLDPVLYPRRYAVLVLLVLVAAGLVVVGLRRSATGRRMIAVRGNERAAAALGVGVSATKLTAFVISAMLAGIGGVLITFANSTVALGNPGGRFDPSYSLNAIAQSTVGGVGYVSGAVVGTVTEPGAVVSRLLQFITSGSWFTLISALLLLVTVITAPSGVAANFARALGRRRGRSTVRQRAIDRVAVTERAPAVRHGTTLEVRGLSVVFGGTHALDDVHLTVRSGSVLGVIGPNGAGKTTLIDTITGYTRAAAGAVLLDGKVLTGATPTSRARASIGRSFQSLELFEDLTVRENLLVGSEQRGPLIRRAFGTGTLSDAAWTAVRRFDLEASLDRLPGSLSYGERRLLAIARALAGDPAVLLLDEPAAGLGASERVQLRSLIRTLATDWGIAVLIIEHDVDLVLDVSDEVVALDFGTVIASGGPAAVRRDARVMSAYFGEDVVVEGSSA